MSMFLRKKWLLPSIINKSPPHEPSAQILRFFKLPEKETECPVVQLSDKFNSIGAVLTVAALNEFRKDHPGFTGLTSLKGGIIALITYCIKPDKDWNNYIIEIAKFNYICDSEPVGDPVMITHEDVAQILKDSKYAEDEEKNNNTFSQASQLVEMADLLSQVDDSVNQSIKRAAKPNQDEMELSENDFIIPEDQKKQLDRIPGWVDEDLSQAPSSQAAALHASIIPSVSQSVHKSPSKAPTEFYQGQLPLQLAVDASIEESEEENRSKDQEQMSIEKDILGDTRQPQSSSGATNTNKDPALPKESSTKVDDTFDEETQGPEDMASYNFQTQSLPMTLSTNDLAKSAEKPIEEPAPVSDPQNTETTTSETPKKKKKKDSSKKKRVEKPASSDVEPAEASQKSTGDASKSTRSTRSKKKSAKSSSSNAITNTEKAKEKSKSKRKSDKTKDKTKDKTPKEKKDKTKKDKSTKDKTKEKVHKEKKRRRKSTTESSGTATSSSNNTSQAAPEPTNIQEVALEPTNVLEVPSESMHAQEVPQPVNIQEAPPKPAEQLDQPSAAQPAVEKPTEVTAPTNNNAPNNAMDTAPILMQETVVLHYQQGDTQAGKDPNKIYDEQNRTIPNLNDDDMDSMMMSFHQELETASQLDLNAVPDFIIEASPDKSSYPIIRDLGSPLITSHTSSQAPSSQLGFHFGHSNQEFSLGMPSDASSQARNVAPSQAVSDAGVSNNNSANNASEGSEDNGAGKSSSSVSQELISGTMRNIASQPSPEKAQAETPAKEKHSLLEEMLMSDPAESNNITDSQADNNDEAEYFTQQPDLLGDSESQWEGTRAPATQGVVPVVPQSQGDLHSEFFSSSDDSGKDKQSQNANARTPEPKDNSTSPSSRKDSISPKARRHLEFSLDKDAMPNSPTKSPPAPSSQKSSASRFKFSLPKTSTTNPQKRINLSTQPQTQLPRVIATSPPKFKRPAAKSPPKENTPAQPSVNNNSPTKAAPIPHSSPEKRQEKEVEEEAEQEVDMVDKDVHVEDDDIDLEITSEQRPPDRDTPPPPLIRINSTDVREDESQQHRQRSRSKSPSPKESNKSRSREEKDDKLKYVIDLEDLSPRFFNKTKKVKHTESNTNKGKSKDRSASASSSSQEPRSVPQHKTPVVSAKKTDKKSPSPTSRPGSLGDLIRQSRQQTLASKDPTMEFVIGYFKEVTSEPKPAPAARAPKFSSNTNSNSSGSSSTVGVKRKIDYYGWLDLTSNKKRKLDHNDNKKK